MRKHTTRNVKIIVAALVLGLAITIPTFVSYGSMPPAEQITPMVEASMPLPAPDNSTTAWKDMNHQQREEYMKKVVMPKMKAEFIAFDAKHFGRMNCMTCHGDGAKDETFKMPNPKLPKLPSTPEGFQKLKEKFPDMLNFMSTTVKPDMAGLLGMPAYSQQNPKGFGCNNCHTSEK